MNLTNRKHPAHTDVQVMCINRELLSAVGIPTDGAGVYAHDFASLIQEASTDSPSDIMYLSRNIVDTKLSGSKLYSMTGALGVQFPQMLGYITVRCGDKYLSYARKVSGESRLLGSRSIGFGGHSEPDDLQTRMDGNNEVHFDPLSSFMLTASRELEEELNMTMDVFTSGLVGEQTLKHVILDNRPDAKDPSKLAVGQVHAGFVITVEIADPSLVSETKEAQTLQWLTLEELKADFDMYESWSQLLIDHLIAQA